MVVCEDKRAMDILDRTNKGLEYSFYDLSVVGQDYDAYLFSQYCLSKGYTHEEMLRIVAFFVVHSTDKLNIESDKKS